MPAPRRTRLVPLALVGALGVAAVACGGGVGAAGPASSAPTSSSSTSSAPPSATASAAEVVEADRLLAARLHQELVVEGENLFLSPHSIAVALSMLQAGARGESAEQLGALLGSSRFGATWHEARRALAEQLAAADPAPPGFEALRLRVANGTFGQVGFPFRAEYLDLLARHYGAALAEVDFAGDPEGARQRVNAWVAERTEDHITDLLPEGSVDDLTRLVLANAVFFSGNWLQPFLAERTGPGTFTRLDGTEVEATFLHGSVRTSYGEGEGWAAVRLRYAGGHSMLVIVPDTGRLADVEARLDAVLAEAQALRGDHQVEVTLPRFQLASEVDLVGALQRLGVIDVFDRHLADLTGVAEGREGESLHVSEAVHQATVAVDEEGTTATAATGVVVGLSSAPPPATLEADRPFLVAIEHDRTGELLFLGRVVDPTA